MHRQVFRAGRVHGRRAGVGQALDHKIAHPRQGAFGRLGQLRPPPQMLQHRIRRGGEQPVTLKNVPGVQKGGGVQADLGAGIGRGHARRAHGRVAHPVGQDQVEHLRARSRNPLGQAAAVHGRDMPPHGVDFQDGSPGREQELSEAAFLLHADAFHRAVHQSRTAAADQRNHQISGGAAAQQVKNALGGPPTAFIGIGVAAQR